MDSIIKTKLIALLKSNKLLPKFEKEIEKLRIKKEIYLDWAESIYAISRLIPNAADDALRTKLTNVNKIWVRQVVTEDKCPQLQPYNEKYGKEAVYNAICYLLEKDAWVSPVDDKGLKAKMPTNYDGLKDIDETITLLQEEEAYKSNKSKSLKVEESESEGENEGTATPAETAAPLPIDTEALKAQFKEFNAAEKAFLELGAAIDKAKELHAAFEHLVHQDEIYEMFEQENMRLAEENGGLREQINGLNDRVDNLIMANNLTDQSFAEKEMQYKRDLKDAQTDAKTLRMELERERRLHKDDNDKAYQNRLAKEKAERDLAALHTEHATTQAELAELRRKAKEASDTPSFKIIPMEDLESLYGMGAKMKSILLPFMEKHGVRFLDADERRKLKRRQ